MDGDAAKKLNRKPDRPSTVVSQQLQKIVR